MVKKYITNDLWISLGFVNAPVLWFSHLDSSYAFEPFFTYWGNISGPIVENPDRSNISWWTIFLDHFWNNFNWLQFALISFSVFILAFESLYVSLMWACVRPARGQIGRRSVLGPELSTLRQRSVTFPASLKSQFCSGTQSAHISCLGRSSCRITTLSLWAETLDNF